MNLSTIQRIGHFFYKNNVPLIPKFFELFSFLVYNSRIHSKVKLGKGTKFAYLGIGCVIHKDVEIGRDCLIGQGITIGGRGKREGLPIIGDNVYIGSGARILGPLSIGDNVIIGPNAVVINNIPGNSIVVGIPGKVIKSNISNIQDYL